MKKVIVITGGTGGIGHAMVRALVGPETKVYFTFHSNRTAADQIVAEFASYEVEALPCDVTNMAEVRSMIDSILDREENGIDTLVNAFGITCDKAFVLMTEEEWHRVIDINLNGTFNVTRSAVFSMMKNRRGHIINLSSVSGLHGLPGQSNYSASKAALVGFSKALAKELAPKNIRVNVIAPGYIETAMTDKLSPEYKQMVLKGIPLGRFGNVGDLDGLIRFLVSEDSGYITGQVFQVDGGLFI